MIRLDEYLFVKGYFDSRTKSKQAVKRKEIYINGKLIDKPSALIADNDCNVEVRALKSFVSLGGYKLDKALNDFDYSVFGLICADIGASTGGFTDCLLQNGASKVYSVDLNDQLLHTTLKENPRVFEVVANAKDLHVNSFDSKIDLLTCDLSFISAKSVMGVFSNLLDYGKHLILLVKPQFENDTKIKLKNGIVRDGKIREQACRKVIDCAIENNFNPLNITTAPLYKDKNAEYLVLFEKDSEKISSEILSKFYNFIHKLTNNN